MRIEDLDATNDPLLESLARLIYEAAAMHAPSWLPTIEDAREEVSDAMLAGRFSRVLLDDQGSPVAWGSTFHTYGAVWEIHPLVVDVKHHRKGHGARLLADIEALAASRGAGVFVVGTSDETRSTSLSAKDLYVDPLAAMASMTFDPSHTVGFWLHSGYSLVGITPDAEGTGMPTINLAKRPPPWE